MEKVPELDIFSRSLSKRKSSLSKFNHHGSSHSSGFGISNTLDYSASSSGFSKSSYHNNNYYQQALNILNKTSSSGFTAILQKSNRIAKTCTNELKRFNKMIVKDKPNQNGLLGNRDINIAEQRVELQTKPVIHHSNMNQNKIQISYQSPSHTQQHRQNISPRIMQQNQNQFRPVVLQQTPIFIHPPSQMIQNIPIQHKLVRPQSSINLHSNPTPVYHHYPQPQFADHIIYSTDDANKMSNGTHMVKNLQNQQENGQSISKDKQKQYTFRGKHQNKENITEQRNQVNCFKFDATYLLEVKDCEKRLPKIADTFDWKIHQQEDEKRQILLQQLEEMKQANLSAGARCISQLNSIIQRFDHKNYKNQINEEGLKNSRKALFTKSKFLNIVQ